MNSIPWYKSPVLVGALVTMLTQAAVLFGVSDAISPDSIDKAVNGVLEVISLGAAIVALVARARSNVQPVTLTKTDAQERNVMSHWLVAIFAGLVLLAVSGCATNQVSPSTIVKEACARDEAYSAVRCAKGVAETYDVYQASVARAVSDPSVPVKVKARLKQLDAGLTPVVIEGLRLTREYNTIRLALAAGETEADKLRIANANIESWIVSALPRIAALGDALGL